MTRLCIIEPHGLSWARSAQAQGGEGAGICLFQLAGGKSYIQDSGMMTSDEGKGLQVRLGPGRKSQDSTTSTGYVFLTRIKGTFKQKSTQLCNGVVKGLIMSYEVSLLINKIQTAN